jgi:hypothetical protein
VFLLALQGVCPDNPALVRVTNYTWGIWLFFFLSGWAYRHLWLDWGLPFISEWMRQVVLSPALLALLVWLIAYGSVWAKVTLAEEPTPTFQADTTPQEERRPPAAKKDDPSMVCGRRGVCWPKAHPQWDKANPAPVGDEWTEVSIKVSYYDPTLGGTNCYSWREGYCWSGTRSGEMWEKWLNRQEIGGAACPLEKLGQRFWFVGREWVCVDTGGKIVQEGNTFWVDLLVSKPPVAFGTVHKAWMAPEKAGWRLGKPEKK